MRTNDPHPKREEPQVPRHEPADPFFLGLLAMGTFYATILVFGILVAPRSPLPEFDVDAARPYLPVHVPGQQEPVQPTLLAESTPATRDLPAPRTAVPSPPVHEGHHAERRGSGISGRIARFFRSSAPANEGDLLRGLAPQAAPKSSAGLRTIGGGSEDQGLSLPVFEATGAPALSYLEPSVPLILVIHVEEAPGADPAPDGVEEVVRRMSGRLRACYESELRVRPNLAGRIVLTWDVYDGRVHDVSIEEDDFQLPSFSDCVVQKVKSWRFPPASEGTTRWPFHFQQGR